MNLIHTCCGEEMHTREFTVQCRKCGRFDEPYPVGYLLRRDGRYLSAKLDPQSDQMPQWGELGRAAIMTEKVAREAADALNAEVLPVYVGPMP